MRLSARNSAYSLCGILTAIVCLGASAHAFSNGMNASLVLGQGDFNSGTPSLSQSGMAYPSGVFLDADGNLWVADVGHNRVLRFSHPFTRNMQADLVLGQIDFTSSAQATTQSGMAEPRGVAVDASSNVWVADTHNHRVLRFRPPFTNGMNANLVLGQIDFNSSMLGGGERGMCDPGGVAVDAGGHLWVADICSNRVLRFSPPFSSHMSADLVLGQVDFNSSTPDTTQSGMREPSGVSVDASSNVWVVDSYNSRVTRFSPPFSSHMSADLVLGQTDFISRTSTTTQSGMQIPTGVSMDPHGNLWVADTLNYRVLRFSPPFSSHMSADLVLGQADFTSWIPATTQSGMWDPEGVVVDASGNVWVADFSNNRVLMYSDTTPLTAPVITSQPASQTVTAPNAAIFSVTATGNPASTYQWELSTDNGGSWSNIRGAASASYNTGATSTAMDGYQYRCLVSNSQGSATSNVATLTVSAVALIPVSSVFFSISPSQTVTAGTPVTLGALPSPANASTPISYQWQQSLGGGSTYIDIPGATGATYQIASPQSHDTGNYRCLASNSANGSPVASNFLTLTVDSCSFSLSPANDPSEPASGATGKTMSVTATNGACPWSASSGAGWLTITGGSSGTGSGTVTYNVAANALAAGRSGSLTLAGTPFTVTQAGAAAVLSSISLSPAAASILAGQTQIYTPACKDQNGMAMRCPALAYASSNQAVATMSGATATGVGAGSANITAFNGSVTSLAATLMVSAAPPPASVSSITVSPASATIVANGTWQFTATAKDRFGNTMSGVAFTWTSSNASAATVNSSGLATGVNTSAGTLATQITASDGGVASNIATLNVSALPPPITLPPPDLSSIADDVGLNDRLSLANASSYSDVTFIWIFTPTGSVSHAPSLGIAVPFRAAAVQPIQTSAAQTASLVSYGLTFGSYVLNVQVVDNTNSSNIASATKTINLVSSDLSRLRVYPNPWRADQHSGKPVIFDQLSGNVTLKIFTVSGHLVKTLSATDGSITWDRTNDSGQTVASGIYLYLVTDDKGNKTTGKLVIIR